MIVGVTWYRPEEYKTLMAMFEDGAELGVLELVGSELVKRAAERAQRKEELLKQQQEGEEQN